MSAIILGGLIFKAEFSYFICWFGLNMKLELELELLLMQAARKYNLILSLLQIHL